MRGFLVLLRKDLREARATLAILLPLTLLVAVSGVIRARMNNIDTSPFGSLRSLAIGVLPCAAWAFSHVIVASELSGKTQLFLEALPVPRRLFFVTKLLLVVAGSLAIALAVAAGTLAADAPPGLRTFVGVRLLAFSASMAGFFFLVGFLGRYRIPLALLVVVAAFVLVQGKDIELWRIAPFALVDDTLVFEREHMPWGVLWQALALFIGCVTAAAVVVSTREGDLPARLAERMSQRERVFIAIVLATFLLGAIALEKKKVKEPYTLPNAAREVADGVEVEVASGVAATAGEQELARFLHDRLRAAHELTGLTFPRVLVVSSFDVPAGVVERGEIEDADGLLYRMRPTASLGQRPEGGRARGAHASRQAGGEAPPSRLRELLLSRAVHDAVARATNSRALKEDRRFVLEGFGLVIARLDHLDGPLELDDDRYLWALAAAPEGPTRELLDAWYEMKERAGSEGADAFAFIGIRVLAHKVGAAKARAFLKGVLGLDVPDDVRAMWRTPAVDDVLLETCGLTRDAWLAAWRRQDAAARARLGAALSDMRRVDAELSLTALSERTSKGVLTVSAEASAGMAEETRVEIQTVTLHVSREPVDEDDATREERDVRALRAGAPLSFSIASGERFAWRIVTLGGEGVRMPSPWHRVEVP